MGPKTADHGPLPPEQYQARTMRYRQRDANHKITLSRSILNGPGYSVALKNIIV
jgi:hypothetical protein